MTDPTNLTAMDRLSALTQDVKDIRAQMKAVAQEAVKEGAKAIFQEYGDILHSFGWRQYTPSFNDGDPCYFTMEDPYLIAKIDTEGLEEDEIEDFADDEGSAAFGYRGKSRATTGWGANEKPNPEYDPRYAAAEDAVGKLYTALSEGEVSKDVFGEFASVVFTPDEVRVEECEAPY